MSLNKDSIRALLSSLAASPQFDRKRLHIKDLEEAEFSEPAHGYATWLWGEIQPSDRGRLTFLFDDSDGTGVFMTIVAASDNSVREIELWRGDGKPVERLPSFEELIEPEPGKTYDSGGSTRTEDGRPEQS